MTGSRAQRADARHNRDAIVVAARSVFDNDEHLRFDDFASRAGVGVGTLYRHFPTRKALAAAVYHGEVEALCENARDSTRSASENLDAFLRGFVDYVVEHTGLARTLAALVDPTLHSAGGSELENTVSSLITRASADGAIRKGVDPGAVMIVLHGIGAATDRPLWASECRAAIELLIAGLTAA